MFPIAECFVAPQGEGLYAGTLMIFLRLAGCSVGKPYTIEERAQTNIKAYNHALNTFAILGPTQTKCSIVGDRHMPCDTDYQMDKFIGKLNKYQILELLQKTHPTCERVCITGGEPMMHDSAELYELAEFLTLEHAYYLHLETSGTIPLNDDLRNFLLSIEHTAVSPKQGFIDDYTEYANEIKLLVDSTFDPDKLPEELNTYIFKSNAPNIWAYLQPINYEHKINEDNLKLCLDLQLKYPHLRISTQMHKVWETR